MKNVETYKSLVQSARDNVDEITEMVMKNKSVKGVYVSHYLGDSGDFITGIIKSDHYLPHGFYIDFGNCSNKKDVLENINEAEKEMNLLIYRGMPEYVGR